MRATLTLDSDDTGRLLAPERVRFGVAITLLLITVVAFILYLSLALEWRSRPFLGAMLSHNMIVNAHTPNGEDAWAGLDGGLRTGDQILSINGQPVSRDSSTLGNPTYQDVLGSLGVGSEVTVEFRRPAIDGELETGDATCGSVTDGAALCEVTYALGTLPIIDFLTFFVFPYVSGLVVLAAGVILLGLRPWDPTAFVAVVVSLLLAIFMGGLFDVGSTYRLSPLWLASGMLLSGTAVAFGMIFPDTIPPARRRRWLRFVPVLAGGALAAYALVKYYQESFPEVNTSVQITGLATIVGMAILATLMFFYQRPRAITARARNQANVVFLGVALGLLPAIVWLITRGVQVLTNQPLIPFSIEATLPFYVIPAMSVAYAILQYRLIDTDRIISQSLTYGIMLVALIIGYFLLVLGASLLTTSVIAPDNPFLLVVTIFFMSLLFIPVRTNLQARIDAIYYRTRRNYQDLLEQFGQKLTSLAGADVMIREFRSLLDDTIQPVSTLVFLRDQQTGDYVAYGESQPETDVVFGPDSGVVRLLRNTDTTLYLQPGITWPRELHVDRARLGILRVMVIAGMPGSEQLNGFVCVGPPRSGARAYNFEELRFVNNLVGQLSVAIERAQVIGSLERRVRELDVLSQVGQAANFTIESDDLLELVSAQTLKLFQSPYFYIVLVEPAANQLYYAFFLEEDERNREKENKRWPIGRDLFSEIVRTSQPKRVDDYTRVMQQNNYEMVFESSEIKAWMGVPLNAGTRTVGVLAVGESDPNKRYSADQLRVFSDIAALAASSLEKARLFTETNIRARQLAVLNEVSRQLVATEGDVERLLDLIMSSAVDILNAEAGSLLLTVEDGTEDLEFRVAVGGTGADLIGTRLPAGHGLVGQVAETGEPVIVNDTSQDERWEGEVVKEGFHTKSVLAVPLVTKDRVVGVLEVINKQDGSIFVEDDVELLTTFAGQAAVAFENARLFQQTDMQLSKRVQELQALERIDVELNRTLDLNKVAEITMRWAIANSGATSGVLGVVNEEKTHLRVLSRYGYKDIETPEGAQNDLWPLDRGIVKRVMRTQRPDLQPDVSIDPDYVPSLRNALSQITVPMFSGDEVNAIIVLETNREPRFNLLDLDWVQRLAEHASIAIANAQLYAELLRANESKSEFVGFAAHELKNPLSSVKGYADLLKSGMPGNISDQQQEFLNIIRSNADRMQTIIDDLRDIAKIDAQQLNVSLSPIDFHNVIVETLRPFQQNLEDKNQKLENNVPEELPRIMADQTRLIQVMTNLLSNAHKYSPTGSAIILEAKVEDHHRTERGDAIGPALHVSVSDNGIGMSKEDLQKLFKVRYFRSSNEQAQDQPGTGLGMMITYNIVQHHNGAIWAESELGEGSTFHVVIPLAPQEEPAKETASD